MIAFICPELARFPFPVLIDRRGGREEKGPLKGEEEGDEIGFAKPRKEEEKSQ